LSRRLLHARVALPAMVLLLVVAGASCNRVSDNDMRGGGELLLQREVRRACYDELDLYWSTTWDRNFETIIDNSKLPDWTEDRYSMCIYWEAEFTSRREEARRGEDLIHLVEGTGWGWILMNRKLEHHIAEIGARWTRTEDGEQTEAGEALLVDAWAEPAEET